MASAATILGRGDMYAFLTPEGGFVIPKASYVGRGLKAAIKGFIARYGLRSSGLLPLRMENNAYNFYLNT